MPRNPHKAHCTFPGCRGWAMRGQQRCYVHRYHVPRPPPETPPSRSLRPSGDSATSGTPGSGATSGTPGSSLASSPGTPRSSATSGTPGSSLAQPDPEAQPADPDPATWPADPDPSILSPHLAALEQRLSALDAHVRRLDAQLEHDPALLPAYTRLLNLQGQLTSRLSRLLRERQQIAETAAQDLIRSATDDALDQASVILGVEL